jgi:hypothetical protein
MASKPHLKPMLYHTPVLATWVIRSKTRLLAVSSQANNTPYRLI